VTSRRRPQTERAPHDAELAPPAGLSAHKVTLDDDEYLVIALPSPAWEMPDCLTGAEQAITALVLRGLTNEEIARERGTSAHTVANQIARIFAKLSVTSRIELAHRLASRKPRENCP
jgi:DNA-binding NarL/FixJ family response regulator